MRPTALRLSITVPAGNRVFWPDRCCYCGCAGAGGTENAARGFPAVPYCARCLRGIRRWTRWIAGWVTVGALVALGPLLYLGTTLDRAIPVQGRSSGLLLIDLAFFAVVLSAIAAAIGFYRRSELYGIQVKSLAPPDVELPAGTAPSEREVFELRFRDPVFYSAALELNAPR